MPPAANGGIFDGLSFSINKVISSQSRSAIENEIKKNGGNDNSGATPTYMLYIRYCCIM